MKTQKTNKIILITGNYGAGKSSALNFFVQHGTRFLSFDHLFFDHFSTRKETRDFIHSAINSFRKYSSNDAILVIELELSSIAEFASEIDYILVLTPPLSILVDRIALRNPMSKEAAKQQISANDSHCMDIYSEKLILVENSEGLCELEQSIIKILKDIRQE